MASEASCSLQEIPANKNAMHKITPHLWFDKEVREAAEFYISLLPGSKISSVTTLSDTPSGDCDVVSFELAGQPFMAISAGPSFKFNPSVSFHIKCNSKEEVDAIWERLSPGGKVSCLLARTHSVSGTGGLRTNTACPGR